MRRWQEILPDRNPTLCIGLSEQMSAIKPDPDAAEFLLLDGNLRVLALKELGQDMAPCLIAKDFETNTYNHRINRLSTAQKHYMLRRAIDKGVSKEQLARAFNVNISTINSRINLLHGICPKAVELMIAANTITAAHEDALLKATLSEQRTYYKPLQPEQPKGDPLEQIVKLEREMKQVQKKVQTSQGKLRVRAAEPGCRQGLPEKAHGERGRPVQRGAACVRDPRAV